MESYDERIDAVGACVGMRGSRIHGIVRELRNENIDVIQYSDNPEILISRALQPAMVSQVAVYEDHKRADVFLHSEEISLAISRAGNNIKLADMLTGYKIEVFREDDQNHDANDVYLDEFLDEIDAWVIETLKGIGCSTAKEVLSIPRDELVERTDLEEETVDNVISILNAEFQDGSEAPATPEAETATQESAAPESATLPIESLKGSIDDWVIDVLKGIGIENTDQVLNMPREELLEKSDLEEETIDDLLAAIGQKTGK